MDQIYKPNKKSEEILARQSRRNDNSTQRANRSRESLGETNPADTVYVENDRSRRILAKYGLADYTDEEKNELAGWQERINGSLDWYDNAWNQLGKNGWNAWQGDADYRTRLDEQIQDMHSYLDGIKTGDVSYEYAWNYLQSLEQMQNQYQKRADFYGQFQNADEYGYYQDLGRSWERAKALGKSREEWASEIESGSRDAAERADDLRAEIASLEVNIPQTEEELKYYPDHDPLFDSYLEQSKARLEEARQELEIAEIQAARGAYQAPLAHSWRYADLPGTENFRRDAEAGRTAYESYAAEQDANSPGAAETYMIASAFNGGNPTGAALATATQLEYRDRSYYEPNDNWSDQEKNTFYWLYQNRGLGSAIEYGAEVNTAINTGRQRQQAEALEEWANQNGWTRAAAWGLNILAAPIHAAEYADKLVKTQAHGVYVPSEQMMPGTAANNMAAAASRYLNEQYGTISEDIPVIGGKGLGDVYQLTNSIAKSWIAAQMGGGAANALFFGEAANMGFDEAKLRGASDEQALIMGFLNGSAEVLGETFSIERLVHMKSPGTIKRFLLERLKQGGVEASEEAFTTLLNTFADAIVMGDKSELNTKIRMYRDQGMSEDKAKHKAWLDWCNDIAADALGGLLSGGVSGGLQQASNFYYATQSEYTGDQQALLELARSQGQDSRAFRLAQEIDGKGWMSQQDALRLEGSLSEDVVQHFHEQQAERERTGWQQQAQERLETLGLSREQIAPAAEAISRELTGEKVERGQRKAHQAALESAEARQTLSELREVQRQQQLSEAVQRAVRAQERKQDRKLKRKGTTAAETESKADEMQPSAAEGSANLDSSVKHEGRETQIRGLTRTESGELRVQVQNEQGETVSVKPEELDYGESGLGELVKELGNRPDAPAMFAAYFSGQDIGDFVNGWNVAKMLGQRSSTATVESVMRAGGALLEDLDPKQVEAAFNYGRSLARQEQEQRAKEKKTDSHANAAALARNDSEGGKRIAAASERTGLAMTEKTGAGKGGVSFEGGTVDGVKLKAVNRARLTDKQRTQIEAVQMLSKATGIRFVFYESEAGKGGRLQGANGLYKDGIIYLDVNAGQHGQSIGQAAIVRTAAHELTHYIQDYAPEHYEELQSFLLDHLIEWKGKSLGDLAAAKIQRDRSGTLTMEQALDEVVADGCEMMLRRTKVMQTMAQENRGLFRIVKDWIQKWTKTIREAFRGVSEVHEEARAVAEMETERLERFAELWDKGLLSAAERAQKSPAKEGGETKYQEKEKGQEEENGLLSYDGLPANAFYKNGRVYDYDFLVSQKPMAVGEMPPMPGKTESFQDIRNNALKRGEENLRLRGVENGESFSITNTYTKRKINVGKGTLRHSLQGRLRSDLVVKSRLVSIAGDLVQNAIPINGLVKENKQAEGTYAMLAIARSSDATFAAIITVDQYSNLKNLELFDVAHAINGRIKREDWSSLKTSPSEKTPTDLHNPLKISIAQVLEIVNDTHRSILSQNVLDHFNEEKPAEGYYTKKTLFQERDELPDDRELLMAVEARGKNAEALTAYQKKVQALEALQRKLGRQREALAAAKETDSHANAEALARNDKTEERIAAGASALAITERESRKELLEKIQKTEASILRAEKVLDEMERDPRLRQEAERALAEWRDANPNEAARALREMRREQETLRRYVELLREEAKLTTPETVTLLPSDVNKLARALLKQYGSDAAVEGIAEKLQKLGDFMASNLYGADTGFYVQMQNQARRIAEEIVRNSYEEIDDNREIREGIRDYLRNTTIQIDDWKGDFPDWNLWRKAHMGTFRFGNEGLSLDKAYHSLQAQFGEGWFPEVNAGSNQIEQILDTLRAVQPVYKPTFGQFQSWRAEEAVANEIMDRLMSGEVRERETMADRAYQERMRELERKYEKKDKARQQALENAEDRAVWEARKRDEAEERRREERALRRQLVQEKVHELRERSIQRDKEYKKRISIEKKTVSLSKIMLENSGKRHVPDAWKEAIGNFLASIDTLTPQSGEKSRAFHIERIEGLQKMVQRQIAANQGLEAIGEKDDGPQKMVAQQAARNEGKETGGTDRGTQAFFLINPMIEEMLEPYVRLARDSDTGRLTTSKMNLEQLTGLEEVLVALREAVDKSNSMLADVNKANVSDTAEEAIAYMEPMGEATIGNKEWKRRARKFVQFENLTPVYFFKLFGEAGERVFKSLRDGQEKEAFNVKEIIAFAEKAYTSKEVKNWEKQTHEFKLIKRESDLSGRKDLVKAAAEGGPEAVRKAEEANKVPVTLSTAQIMGLYCLSKDKQALEHILGGGIQIQDIETQKGTKRQSSRYLVKPEDLAAIVGTLTPRQKEVAEELQRYMNTRGSSWGNEVSRALFGVDLFTVENYYPIQTDPQSRPARNPDVDNTDLLHLLHMGFTKSRVKNADNGILLFSIFDVFSNHMSDMARYNAMSLPLADALKWFNYLDESNGHFTSVRAAMETAYGKEAERYFLTLMQDINGYQAGKGDYIGAKMVSNAKVAAVGANLRVAALQPTSYVRALAVLDPKYLGKGIFTNNKQGIREAMQYSGTANWKDLGFFDLNVNANVSDLIKHSDGVMDAIKEKSMLLAEKADRVTWGAIWNACKAEVRGKTGLSGEELMKATKERFAEVIYETQVMDSVLTRSQMMRKKDLFHGMATSFMAEPTLSYNLLLNSVNSYLREKKMGGHPKAWKIAGPIMARAFTTYALSQIVASFVESLFDALRDDDDYEDLWEKWKQAEFGWDGNLIQDLAPWNKLPYLRDLVSIIQGFSNKRMDTEWMEYWTKAIKAVVSDFKPDEEGNIKGFTWGTAYKCMRALSTTTGLPIGNAVRDATALWNGLVVQFVPDWKLKTVKTSPVKPEAGVKQAYQAGALSEEDAVRYLMRDAEVESEERARQLLYEWGLEKGEKKYDALLAAARAGDSEAFQSSWDELAGYGYSEKSLHSAVKSAVKEWYQGTGEDEGQRMSKQAAIETLVQFAGMRRREAEQTVQEWTSYVSSPEKLQYDEIKDAYLSGEITRERAEEMRALFGNKDENEAADEVNKWRCERETGIPYSEAKAAYLDGEIDRIEAVRIRMEYGGQSREEAEDEVNKWSCEKETGVAYDEIRDLYVRKEITAQQVRSMLITYGGYSEDEAEVKLMQYDYVGTNVTLAGSSEAEAKRYYMDIAELGIKKETWHSAWNACNGMTSDKDENGKTIKYSLMNKQAAYIDGLNLTSAQKDAILLQLGYAESSLLKTPWHN